jgi:translation elongation factor EF-Ts
MGREERRIAQEMVGDAIVAVEMIRTEGVQKAMSKFNRRATEGEEDS